MPEETKEAPVEDDAMEGTTEAAAAEGADEKPQEPKELEEDAPADGRPKLKAGDVRFLTEDRTMNVLSTVGGKLLTSLSDGGCQYLLAGARASVGLRGGRHLFEVTVVEHKNPSEPAGARSQGPKPRWLVRIGVSTADSSLLLADGAESVAFDSEGYFLHGSERKKVSTKFSHSQVFALLLNLDAKSPHANTVSLFCDGARVSAPQPLPEALRGKPLYPAVTYRNVTLQVNFGPRPLKPLPFRCSTWQEAAEADCELRREPAKAGPNEVLLPLGLPDEATFDWLDQFLAQHRNYVELSERSILEWAKKSGIPRPGGYAKRSSNDRPDTSFGLPLMDDGSIKRVLMAAAPLLQRNYVVMEVRGNLLAEDRKAVLDRFAGPDFKRVAEVVMGEPPEEYRTWIQDLMLKEKRSKAEAEARRKKQDEAKRKADEDAKRKRLQEERKRKLASAKKTEDDGEQKEADQEQAEPAAAEQAEEIKVELTEQEKKLTFRKKDAPDVGSRELAASYANFTLAGQDEGFDEVRFAWADKAQSEEYLRKFILSRKLTQRIENLEPSEWFKEKWSEWTKSLGAWKKKHQDFNQKKKAGGKKEGDEAKGQEVDAEDLDVFAVEDVTDIGNGEPLFANWVYEDWTLLSLRFEMHLLVHAFRHDVDDPDRPTFTENHLGFYYTRYFKKSFDVKNYGFTKLAELIGIMEDTVEVNSKTSMIEAQLSNDTPVDNFVKLTEDHRRDRQRRLDAGDETALLKFARPAPAAPPPRQAGSSQRSYATQGRDENSSRGSGYSSGGPPQAYGSQKRSYAPPAYPPSKYPRSAYSSSGGAPPSRYGGYEGSSGGGYRRR